MKTLAVICALVACCAALPGLAYNSYASVLGLGHLNPSFYSAPAVLPYSQYLSAPLAKSVVAPVVAAAPALVTKSVAVPAVTTTHAVHSVPAVAPVVPAVAPVVPAVASAYAVSAVPAVAPVVPAVATAHAVAAAPVVAPAVTKTQWHAQTEHGQASYGHTEPLQAHSAHQDAHGNKVGSYSYVNPHDGQVHRTDYVADALGYRVVANDLPADTPAVALAKSAHLAAHLRAKRGLGYTVATPYSLATPYNVVAAPLNYAAVPAHYSAVQTTVVNNPGHAVSYRVD